MPTRPVQSSQSQLFTLPGEIFNAISQAAYFCSCAFHVISANISGDKECFNRIGFTASIKISTTQFLGLLLFRFIGISVRSVKKEISALTEFTLISALAWSSVKQRENWGKFSKEVWEEDIDSHLGQGWSKNTLVRIEIPYPVKQGVSSEERRNPWSDVVRKCL